jgi:UDPglucose--hexose-1-phosphate uridylyltransferase
VVIAAHRQHRPWNAERVEHEKQAVPRYVSDCYLCPGNQRVSGARNADYEDVFVFDNDHPCVAEAAPEPEPPRSALHQVRRANGVARVVCYSPRHDVSLAELSVERIAELMRVWQEQYRELGAMPGVECVLVFENRGEVVGVSNPHPHCQIYATNFTFKTLEVELDAEREHLAQTGRGLFEDVIAAEREDGRRILAENDGAIAFLPYFARYAYETYVAPKARHPSLATLSESEVFDLARVLSEVLIRFDNLWQMPFPYVLALHQAPTDGGDHAAHHFHIQIHPPLRKPNLLKYLAGPEVGGGSFISDTSPEEKAAELQAVSTTHHRLAQDRAGT